jgi:hypothetical protein
VIRERQDGLYLFLLGCAVFVLVCVAGERLGIAWLVDFKAAYYGTRCLIEHGDPYNPANVLQVFKADAGGIIRDPLEARRLQAETPSVYPPTSFLVVAPFAALDAEPAQVLWMAMTAALLLASAFLVWSITADVTPVLSGILLCIWLIDAIPLVLIGNPAGIAIALCIIAVWCFTKNSFEIAGVLCLAISLVLKPQDAWLVWLFYVPSGRIQRRRAFQVAAVVVASSCAAIVWVVQSSPHWLTELHNNLRLVNLPDSINDPGPANMALPTVGPMIHLQTVFAIFWSAPSIYNPLTYSLCGALIAIWAVALDRGRLSSQDQWFAIAAGAFLSLLPVYHRTHDAKLILLAVPACAMLRRENGVLGRAAVWLTSATFVLTGDIPLYIVSSLSGLFPCADLGILGKIVTSIVFRPAPLLLLVSGSFYLWVYVHRIRRPGKTCPPSAPPSTM